MNEWSLYKIIDAQCKRCTGWGEDNYSSHPCVLTNSYIFTKKKKKNPGTPENSILSSEQEMPWSLSLSPLPKICGSEINSFVIALKKIQAQQDVRMTTVHSFVLMTPKEYCFCVCNWDILSVENYLWNRKNVTFKASGSFCQYLLEFIHVFIFSPAQFQRLLRT